jgi:hypothetical protein
MVKTPNKEQIREKALQLWYAEQYKHGITDPTNPEDFELKENGFWSQAISELMRDNAKAVLQEWEAYDNYVQNMKAEDHDVKAERENEFNEGLPLDFLECERSNILVSGTNQTGKTLCAISVTDLLMVNGWQVLVFDVSGVWKAQSNIAVCYELEEGFKKYFIPINASAIYDLSLLTLDYQRKFVNDLLANVWKMRVNEQTETNLMLVFEEFQLYARTLRNVLNQNLLRVMTVGANVGIRCLGITPDLALVDPLFIRLCNQRYHFHLGNEWSAKRRFRHYYGKEWLTKALALRVGECIYYNNGELSLWRIPKFDKIGSRLKIEYSYAWSG